MSRLIRVLAVGGLSLALVAATRAGRIEPLENQLRILEQGGVPARLIPGAEHRVGVFTYEDPDRTGLSDALGALVAREVLTNSRVGSIGVIFFEGGLSPSAGSALSYFDKVERVTAAQAVKLAVWGIVRAAKDGVEVTTFAQVPSPVLEEHFFWRLRLPLAMGGGDLVARLRPDRILVQRLVLSDTDWAELLQAAEEIAKVRSAPQADAQVIGVLPKQETYYITQRQGAWVYLQTRSGVAGWAPTEGHCRGQCGRLLQAAAYAGRLLRYMADRTVPGSGSALSAETRAVADQLQALELLNSDRPEDLRDAVAIARDWQRRGKIPPGGAAFGNIEALGTLAIGLQETFAELAGPGHKAPSAAERTAIYDRIELSRSMARELAFDLAEASLYDPRNREVLHNLSVLFRYTGDPGRAELAQRLAGRAAR